MTRKIHPISLLLICYWMGLSACQPQPQAQLPPSSPYPLLTEIDLGQCISYSRYDRGNREPCSHYFLVDSLDWNPTSDQIAIGSNQMVYLYSFEDEELLEIVKQPGRTADIAWSPDGLRLAGTEMRLWVWDSQTNGVIYNKGGQDTYADYHQVYWSMNGHSVLSTAYHINTQTSGIERWDTTTDQVELLNVLNIENPGIQGLSPNDRLVAVTDLSDTKVSPLQVFELSSGQVIHTFEAGETLPAAWNPAGTRFVTDTLTGDWVVWDTANWQPVTILPNQGDFNYSVEWHPGGDYLAAAGVSGVIIWNIDTTASTAVHDQKVFDVAWDSDGDRLATALGDVVYIWDVTQLP
jgi:WD40 repeat protein